MKKNIEGIELLIKKLKELNEKADKLKLLREDLEEYDHSNLWITVTLDSSTHDLILEKKELFKFIEQNLETIFNKTSIIESILKI